MSVLKNVLLMLVGLGFLAIGTHAASAQNIYLSQSGGTFSGGTACNGQSTQVYTFFNNSGNWGSGGSQIGSDTVVWICGTITCSGAGASALTFQGSGTSGHPVTIKFDSGGDLSCSSYWGDNAFTGGPGAINCSGQNYVTVDGNNVGIIENTNNGTGLGNQHNSTGVYFNDCGNPTIKNLTVRNIYLKNNVSDTNEFGVGVWVLGGNNWLITNNTINNGWSELVVGWDANNVTNANNVISYNTLDYGCHILNGPADGNTNEAASNITIDHNTIGPHVNIWADNATNCHADPVIAGAQNSGSTLSNITIANNTILSDGCPTFGICTAPLFFEGATNAYIFNNVIGIVNGGSDEAAIRLSNGPSNSNPQTNLYLFNNTIVGPSGSQSGVKMDSITNLVAKNNIFLNLGQAWWDNTGGNFSQFSSASAINFNDYYNMAYNIGSGSARYSNLSSWQGAGHDPNATTGNPMLNSSYVPQSGSAVLGLGANLTSMALSALNTDRAGIQRPTSGPWAAGVYQSSGSLPAPPSNVTASIQ